MRQVANLDGERTATRGEQPHLLRAVEMKGCGVQPVARLVPVKGKVERGGTCLHPVEMELQPQQPLVGFEPHRFDQVKTVLGHARKFPLCQTLIPFG